MQDLSNKVNNGGANAQGILDADEFNQLATEATNLITSAGLTPTSGDLSQWSKAVSDLIAKGNFFTGGGFGNSYTAGSTPPAIAPSGLTEGMTFSTTINANNTGAATMAAFGLGPLPIHTDDAGTELIQNELRSGELMILRYSTVGSPHWVIENPASKLPAGYKQTWQNVTASRIPTVGYQNTTGRTIVYIARCQDEQVTEYYIDGIVMAERTRLATNYGEQSHFTGIVPPNSFYGVNPSNGTSNGTIIQWMELRD